ncbi:neprosin family prolyl endopeptidase [Actinoplanes sp. NPDC051346]|uniref:neprosin family prolyl endopeptidase n=1 Tax=Actinoplanes sp. NPDC051346 TaxID=3155048 RepID=UPI0034445980
MSNTRRGWLAAGLTTTVAVSMSAGWNLNAYAEEAPPPVAAEAGEPVPPALLPWGEQPSRLKRAKAGVSSAAVAAAGADAAPAEAGESREPEPVYAPKGSVPLTGSPALAQPAQAQPAAQPAQAQPAAQPAQAQPAAQLAQSATKLAQSAAKQALSAAKPAQSVTQPAQPAAKLAQARPADEPAPASATRGDRNKAGKAGAFYHYAAGTQIGATDGTSANLHIAKPELAAADAHTLTEIAVQSADSKQIVEVGWTVDRKVNGDDDPHLFVFYWKDGKPACYNACGFKVYSQATIKPGATLPTGVQKRFGVQRSGSNWWIAYDSEWIGYYPDDLWNGSFTRAGATQWFGEVASATEETCTDMGKGLPPTDGTASRIGTIQMVNGPDPNASVHSTSPHYGVLSLSPSTFRYGGPGSGPC